MSNEQQMNTGLSGLFANGGNNTEATNSNQSLTQQLTSHSEQIAKEIINQLSDDDAEQVEQSMKTHDAMDDLVNNVCNLNDEDVSYLTGLQDEEYDKMIRSQQSKRSRAKSKVMTKDNYLSLMTGAVAENLLRVVSGKEKTAGGGQRKSSVEYTDEELQELANDQDKLKKAIRNIQSKKSIMKSKANFDEQSDEYQKLLTVEEQLKSLRVNNNPQASKAVEVTQQIEETLSEVENVDKLKADESKELLKKISEALAHK